MIATISQKLTSRRRTARAINSAMAAAAIAHPATAAPQVLKIYQHRPPAPVQAATPPSNDQRHRRRRHQHDGADADHVLCRVPEVDGPKEVVRVGGLGRQVADQLATGIATTSTTPATAGQRAGRSPALCSALPRVICLRLLIAPVTPMVGRSVEETMMAVRVPCVITLIPAADLPRSRSVLPATMVLSHARRRCQRHP
jgi:hypothetical protein